MTLKAYRLGVVLRWRELCSLKEKGTPLKINLQSLRKIHEWPTCVSDESPWVEEIGESPYRMTAEGTEMPPDSFLEEFEENLDQGDVEVILIRRSKARRRLFKGVDLRNCDFVDVDDEDIRPVEDPKNIQLPGSSDNVLASSSSEYFVENKISRKTKRARKNNKFISDKKRELQSKISDLEKKRDQCFYQSDKDHYDNLIEKINVGIDKLCLEQSDIDVVDVDNKSGYYYPPVYEPVVKRPGVTLHKTPRGTEVRVRPVFRRLHDQSFGYVCGGCKTPLSGDRSCGNTDCVYNGLRIRYPRVVQPLSGPRLFS